MADFFGETETTEIDPSKDYLAEYVGEGKKFADAKELARAKAEADAHIARIEAENAEFRERMLQSKSVEDLMDQINSKLSATRQDGANHAPENEPEKTSTSVSPEDLEKLVIEKMTQKQREDQAKANTDWVMSQLQQKFGADYGKRVQAAATDLGMTKEDLQLLAAQKPKAFMKLVTDNQPAGPQRGYSPPESRVNTQAQPQTGQKNYGYYSRLRRSDPKMYWSPQVQSEMHREAIKQGAAFFD